MTKYTDELKQFLDNSCSCFHAVKNLESMLEGYTKLDEKEDWKLERGKGYYVIRKDSSIIAFIVPSNGFESVKITAAHSDSPSFKVKPGDELSSEFYTRINTEKYGGMLMAQWLDRPLSVAGRLIVKDNEEFKSVLVNVDKDLLLMPSVAIHMNREANDGYKYNAKVDTIPLAASGKGKGRFMDVVAEASGVNKEDILGSDLFLYNRDKAKIWGMDDEFISSRALDDLQCAFGTMKGFILSDTSENTLSMCAVFDNEEVGSLTGQGADSTFLADTLLRINESLGYKEGNLLKAIANGYMISADNAHAVHPNHPEYADEKNKPEMNKGIVIKYNANQKYTTDAVSEAMFRDVCTKAKVPVQTYANRSDLAGGSTLGNLSNRHISIRTVDIGLPQLSMHSPYETAGVLDTDYLVDAIKVFFSV